MSGDEEASDAHIDLWENCLQAFERHPSSPPSPAFPFSLLIRSARSLLLYFILLLFFAHCVGFRLVHVQ